MRRIAAVVAIAVLAGVGGAYLLTRALGPHRAKELAFFADDLPAAEAAALEDELQGKYDLAKKDDLSLAALQRMPSGELAKLARKGCDLLVVNDVSGGLADPAMAPLVAEAGIDLATDLVLQGVAELQRLQIIQIGLQLILVEPLIS